jgi:hypothetical protein
MERLSLMPWKALIPEPARGLVKERKGPLKFLHLFAPAYPETPRDDTGMSKGLIVLIFFQRLGCQPGLLSQEKLC